ncbi:hypothetical protein AAZX31_04G032400 [Glycine max]|uniref:uncharacterized protein n=1 Tax=Glycine max TaxID=3847 RepID=UPI0003DEB05B|nr:uncharacterized protein LOC100797985 [Glycine max]XP_028227576.1 uncharacterized protein LOC114408649 [Glycine soja]KAG4391903.1 hypothetical protein GLYMA_04G032951v4 [Glycine max]KAH1109558.1 hypothetical protein GYH30_008794 [Glycine max]|eukprot:XP_025983945.1 uncharacterized protein LOC100797985 [Glycine max]
MQWDENILQGDEYDDSVQSRGKTEVGGFVLWQKNPDLWCLELVVSGFKVGAGINGKLAWNHSSSQPFHANKGPSRPLRRFFQGLDSSYKRLQAQSTSNTEIVMHTILGYFGQRTGY